jgi:hypothetical protein
MQYVFQMKEQKYGMLGKLNFYRLAIFDISACMQMCICV